MDYRRVMDEKQLHLHEHFPSTHYLSDPEHVKRTMEWVTFWRRNINLFIEYYFNMKLHLFQHIILYLMTWFPSICIVAARSASKSFIIAAYACAEAILRPGSKIVIASATKKQARLIVTEKIKKEIMPNAPLLAAEIEDFRTNQNEIEVVFKNGSSIIVVTADDNSRGYRATIMIYEEFRMIKKYIVDSVLSPFLVIRQAPFLNDEQYGHLQEESKEIYISSAWYKNHWMWKDIIVPFSEKMVQHPMGGDQSSLVIAMDYSVALRHRIKTRNFLLKEKRKLDAVAWAIEYENQMIAENANAYFTYEMLNKNRTLKKAFFPRKPLEQASKWKARSVTQKQPGEIRIVSCDIATAGGNDNDNSVFSCIRLLPESKEYKATGKDGEHIEVKQGYRRQVPYMEARNGGETSKQAIRIKQLFNDFDADYCVLDIQNAGRSIYDALAKVLYDEERNCEYAPWKAMNNDDMAGRIVVSGQIPVIFTVSATGAMNSDIAVAMRKTLEDGMIDLLVNHHEGVEYIQQLIPEYATADPEDQLFYERPYLETVALINEMISLEYSVSAQTGYIKVEEKGKKRKDRYTSVAYGNYFASMLEQDLLSDSSEYEYLTIID